jgi:hypothetical protein
MLLDRSRGALVLIPRSVVTRLLLRSGPLVLALGLLALDGASAATRPVHYHLFIETIDQTLIYSAEAQGNVAPGRVIDFPSGYFESNDFAVNDRGEVFVCGGSTSRYPPSVLVYGAHASGLAQPKRVISGANTQLDVPRGIAVDQSGSIYVADYRKDQIVVFAPGAEGNVAPVRIIAGPHTLLNHDDGALAVDGAGNLFVEQGGFFQAGPRYHKDRLLEFPPNAQGDTQPIATYVPPHYHLQFVAVSDGELFVTLNQGDSQGAGYVEIFSLPSLQHVQTVRIPQWGRDLVVGADAIPGGDLYVLTMARRHSAVWRFHRHAFDRRKFDLKPAGYLNGSLGGFDDTGILLEP